MADVEKAVLRQQRAEDEESISPGAGRDLSSSDANPNAQPAKKRRRGAKANADRKFECKHEGCGKSYSRAEHLYRHQLNRQYFCDC